MQKIRLYDSRSGLHMDREIKYATPIVVLQQFDDKYLYSRTFEVTDYREHENVYLYRYKRTEKIRVDYPRKAHGK